MGKPKKESSHDFTGEHHIARCLKCGTSYYIDYEPAKDCEHADDIEAWTVDIVKGKP